MFLNQKAIFLPAICSLAGFVVSSTASFASDHVIHTSSDHQSPEIIQLQRSTFDNFALSRSCPTDEHVVLKAMFSENGPLTIIKFVQYTSDDQYNAECLDAVCNVFKKDFEVANDPFELPIGVNNGLHPHPRDSTEPFNEFKNSHPDLFKSAQSVVVIHRIPLNLSQGATSKTLDISPEFLTSPDNLVAIAIDESPENGKAGERSRPPRYVKIIEERARRWAKLFSETKQQATKEQIFECAKQLDSELK